MDPSDPRSVQEYLRSALGGNGGAPHFLKGSTSAAGMEPVITHHSGTTCPVFLETGRCDDLTCALSHRRVVPPQGVRTSNVPPPPPSDTRSQLPCLDFLQGACQKGSICRYLHVAGTSSPTLPAPMMVMDGTLPSSAAKIRIQDNFVCRDYQNGRCHRAECRFEHLTKAEETSVYRRQIQTGTAIVTFCKDYQLGRCQRVNCKYYHGQTNEEQHMYVNLGLHVPEDLTCKDFLLGRCYRATCRYSHGITTEQQDHLSGGVPYNVLGDTAVGSMSGLTSTTPRRSQYEVYQALVGPLRALLQGCEAPHMEQMGAHPGSDIASILSNQRLPSLY